MNSIIIEDHSQSPHEGIWATDAEVASYQVVEDTYVVFEVVVTTLRGTKVRIWRRYAEFDAFYNDLIEERPEERLAIPTLPPKSGNRGLENAAFQKARLGGLDYFVKCALLNPNTARSTAVKRFISNQDNSYQ